MPLPRAMPGELFYDGFVRDVAERLKKDGLRAWFDEWEIRLGDSAPEKFEAL